MPRRKSKKFLLETAKAYVEALLERYPRLEIEIDLESPWGFDIWVQVELPRSLSDDVLEVQYLTAELDYDFWERTGVNIIATVADKQPIS